MGRTLLDALEEGWALADPARASVVGAAGALGPEALLRGARGVAAALTEAGVGRGARVGLWMEKGPAAVEALLGVLWAGAAYVPLDPRSPPARCATIARDCGLEALVADGPRLPHLPAVLEGIRPRLLLLDEPDAARRAAAAGGHPQAALAAARALGPRPAPRPAPDDLAYVLYTSGSTGVPKGVVHTHASGVAFVDWVRATFGAGPADVFASHAPLHFDLSICDVLAGLASGGQVRLIGSLEAMLAPYLARMLEPWGVTVWYSVPSVLTAMLDEGLASRPPAGLRLVLFAGEVFPTPQLRRLRRALPHARLANLFGPTETNVCTSWDVPPELPGSDAPIPIGPGCAHLDTFAVDDDGREVREVGGEGTLWVRGGNVMQGYWNDPARTAQVLRPDPRGRPGLACCTGDRVRLLPDGGYAFLGRRDHMVKTRGYRVELGEVEAALTAHPDVLEAVVTALPDPAIGHRLVASTVLRRNVVTDPEALRAHVAARLPGYMVPAELEVRDELPRTSTGKADRGRLRGEWERRTA